MAMQKLYLTPQDRNRIRNRWQSRIGKSATESLVWSRFCIVVAPPIAACGFILALLHGIDSTSALTVLAIGLVIIAVLVMITGLALLWYGWHSAGKRLGAWVSMFRPPPTDDEGYVAWCVANHVEPYAFHE